MRHFTTITGKDIEQARLFLEQGHTVAIPTETVYGLAANALDEEAVVKIFEVKNRPQFDPLIVHLAEPGQITDYVQYLPRVARRLMDAFMPGPLTLLLPKKAILPAIVTAGLDTVGIRVPAHPLTRALLQSLNFPLAAPSANPFGYISPTRAQHVYDQLQGQIPYILDGDIATIGIESTIIGFEDDTPVVYRLGGLAIETIEAITGPLRLQLNSSSDPRAPGMLKSHYAPRKKLYFDPLQPITAFPVGVIAFNRYSNDYPENCQHLLAENGHLQEAAIHLFDVMRRLDNSDVKAIVALPFPEEGLGRAINDRLRRAAAE